MDLYYFLEMAKKKARHASGVAQKKARQASGTVKKKTREALKKAGRAPLPKIAALVLLSMSLLMGFIGLYYYGKFTRLIETRLRQDAPVRTAIYSRPFQVRNGRRMPAEPRFLSNLFGENREKRRYVRFEQLPEHLIQAVLAAEDEDFFSHPGLDWSAILRASFINLTRGKPVQGGSTLTQQFIKNYFLSPEKSLSRKLEEVCMAVLLENRLSKEEIFELYANEIYLGQAGSFAIAGFGQGARTYFAKDVQELTLEESTLLAGIIRAPNRYSPHRHPEDALRRRNYILTLMARNGIISQAASEEAGKKPIQVVPLSRQNYSEAPYFVDYVRGVIRNELEFDPQATSGLEVYTTLDPDLQKAAVLAVRDGMSEVDKLLARRQRNVSPEAALLAVDPRTGEILAMLGGRDYAVTQFNRAVQARRQPGSSFKPFVYAAALQVSLERFPDSPYTLSSLIVDEPYEFPFDKKVYAPNNYRREYFGPVTLRKALALSLNIPTVKLAEQIGFDSVVSVSQSLGLKSLRPYPSVALGTFGLNLIELAQAYTAFANAGAVRPLHAVNGYSIKGAATMLPERESRPVLKPEVAFLVTSALESTVNEGTAFDVRTRGFHLPAAGKTGTSEDGWFVGYTPDLLCAVWVGLDNSQPLRLTGTQAALPIWTRFMVRARELDYLSGEPFPVPDNIVSAQIDAETGFLATDYCVTVRTEYYVAGTEPRLECLGEIPSFETLVEQRVHESPRRGFWGWMKNVFR